MRKQRIKIIDYLKALAIILVILNHSNIFLETNPVFLYLINEAVPIFLILSGYIYCYREWQDDLYTGYRLSKIFEKIKRFSMPLIPVFLIYLCYELFFRNTGGVW